MYDINLETLMANQYLFNHKKQFNIEVGMKIKEIRTNKKMPKKEMAFQTLMSPTYITQIENGINGITLNKFIIICNALQIHPKEILDDFLFDYNTNEVILYDELQQDKNIVENIKNYLKNKK